MTISSTLIIDNITDDQKSWLNSLAVRWMKSPVAFIVTDEIFKTFETRGWVEGTSFGCKLTVRGWEAARRIIGEKEIGVTKKKARNKTE